MSEKDKNDYKQAIRHAKRNFMSAINWQQEHGAAFSAKTDWGNREYDDGAAHANEKFGVGVIAKKIAEQGHEFAEERCPALGAAVCAQQDGQGLSKGCLAVLELDNMLACLHSSCCLRPLLFPCPPPPF